MPPEPSRPLDEQDYDNIRSVTSWVLQNATAPIEQKDLVGLLASKGFDKRFFDPVRNEQNKNELSLETSTREIYNAIRGAELTGNMPDVCDGVKSKATGVCKVEIDKSGASLKGFRLPGYNLRITLNGQSPINLFILETGATTIDGSDDGDDGVIYPLPVLEWSANIKIGDRVHSGFIYFRKGSEAEQEGLSVESLFIEPGVVVSIDKTRTPICLMARPKVANLVDDALYIHVEGAVPNVVENLYETTPPFGPCTEDNVTE